MKAIKFKESEYYSLELPKGEYLIDDKYVENTSYSPIKVQVLNIDDVKPVSRYNITNYYTSNGDDNLSIDDFNNQFKILLNHSVSDEDGNRFWNTLEDEYNYKKFNEKWKPIYKNIEVIGEPYKIEILESQIETNNPYIKSDYINGGNDPILFVYNRQKAVLDIVSNKFKELGMEYKDNISYGETKNKKIWSKSDHSGIRYTVAFGTYIFNDNWKVERNPRRFLNDLIKWFEKDKKELEDIIQNKYNEHFGMIDDNKFNFKELLVLLRSSQNSLFKARALKASQSDFNNGKCKLNQAITLIEESFK